MLSINSNETKKIKFGISISGVDARDLKGALRLNVEGVEYGFPVTIEDNKVVAVIPPLKDLIKQPIDEHKRYDVKLELIANDTYIAPWTDVAKIKMPVSVEVAENIEEEEISTRETISLAIGSIDEEVIEEKKVKPKRLIKKKITPDTKLSKIFK